MKLKIRRLHLVIGFGALILLAGLGSATLKKSKPIPPEKIVNIEKGDIARSVVARGKIEPLSKVEIKSKANGIIKVLAVDVGDPVEEGQVLAELDKEDLQAQVRGAKASQEGEEANVQAAVALEHKARVEAANPDLAFSKRDYERVQALFHQKIASQQQLDDASRALEVARNRQQLLDASVETAAAQAAQAKSRVAAAKASLDRAEENLRTRPSGLRFQESFSPGMSKSATPFPRF
jgi:HlyD family secretion protein